MKMALSSLILAAVLLAPWPGGAPAHGDSAAQQDTTLGVDADPTGNTATSLGPIDPCVSVNTGDTFEVDLFVTDVVDLLAWEAYFVYDIDVISVVERDVRMFQAANEGSQVFDVSESLPDIDARYRVAAADIASPPAPDSGSGVLARLTLKAIGAGVSPASLSLIDVNDDGTIDLGPFLNGQAGIPIGDADEDGFFDGPISNAQIAVDTVCPAGTPVASPAAPIASPTSQPATSPTAQQTPGSATPEGTPTPAETVTASSPPGSPAPGNSIATEDEDSAWTSGVAIIGYVAGGLGALLLGGIGLFSMRRSRAR